MDTKLARDLMKDFPFLRGIVGFGVGDEALALAHKFNTATVQKDHSYLMDRAPSWEYNPQEVVVKAQMESYLDSLEIRDQGFHSTAVPINSAREVAPAMRLGGDQRPYRRTHVVLEGEFPLEDYDDGQKTGGMTVYQYVVLNVPNRTVRGREATLRERMIDLAKFVASQSWHNAQPVAILVETSTGLVQGVRGSSKRGLTIHKLSDASSWWPKELPDGTTYQPSNPGEDFWDCVYVCSLRHTLSPVRRLPASKSRPAD